MDSLSLITQVALGFIAFVIGNEFRLSALESMGKQAITVGILQAVMTTALVDAALVILHFIRPDIISMASAITLGAIAAATAPAATLMVVKQYKADGPLTRLLLMVVAIDDAVGLVLFSVLVYELVGPTLTKLALTAAGEIIPEGRTNARMANKPEFPVSLD